MDIDYNEVHKHLTLYGHCAIRSVEKDGIYSIEIVPIEEMIAQGYTRVPDPDEQVIKKKFKALF